MEWSIVIGAAAACLAGGFFPLSSSEAVVVGAALLLPVPGLPALVLACAGGQMVAKCVLYGLTRWAPQHLPARARALLSKTDRFREKRGLLGLAVFSGSVVSVPPFYLTTLAAGALRVPFLVFLLAGSAGTVARYAALAWVAATVVTVA